MDSGPLSNASGRLDGWLTRRKRTAETLNRNAGQLGMAVRGSV
jgi:hypothetical protein